MTGDAFPTDIPEATSLAFRRLRAAGVANPARDMRLLLARAINQPKDRLALFMQGTMSDAQAKKFAADIQRRTEREPISLITGRKDFYGRSFAVGPSVLAPRPETECLIDLALAEPFERVLDLGLGCGCILLTLLLERGNLTSGIGIEKSRDALRVAMENRDAFDLAVPAVIGQGDWFNVQDSTLRSGLPKFDLIVSNPPYIAVSELECLEPEVREYEPRIALTDGGDGLAAYHEIARGAADHLTPDGRLLVEIGPTQAVAVTAIFRNAGLNDITIHHDLDGRDRVVAARN